MGVPQGTRKRQRWYDFVWKVLRRRRVPAYCPGPGKRRNSKHESLKEKTEVRSKDESYYKDKSSQKTKVTKRRMLPTDESQKRHKLPKDASYMSKGHVRHPVGFKGSWVLRRPKRRKLPKDESYPKTKVTKRHKFVKYRSQLKTTKSKIRKLKLDTKTKTQVKVRVTSFVRARPVTPVRDPKQQIYQYIINPRPRNPYNRLRV